LDKAVEISNYPPMNIQHHFTNPVARVLVGAITISFSGVWVKIADVSPTSSAFYRVFFGAVFLFIFSAAMKESWKIDARYFFVGVACGLIFVIDLLCWHGSIVLIGPGLATLLSNFQVFILAAVGIIFLKERYSQRLLLSIPLAVAALFLIIGFQWQTMTPSYRYGVYLGLATAVFYALYIFSLKHLSTRNTANFFPMALVSFASTSILALFMLSSGETFAIPDLKSGTSLLALGFFSQFLGWFLIATSLPKVETSFTGLILLIQPSLSFVWDVLFFHRPTTLLNWIGVTLALTAIYLGLTSRRTKL